MFEIDPRSILLMVGLGLIVPAISLSVVWRLYRGLPGLGHWTLSTWTAFSVVFTISARSDLPSDWMVLLTSATIMGTALLIYAGCRAYAGKAAINKTILLPAFAAALLVIGVLRVMQMQPVVHVSFQALFTGAVFAASALTLWSMPALRSPLKYFVCLTFGLHSVFLILVRPIVMQRQFEATNTLAVPPIVSIESFIAWSFIILGTVLLTVDYLYGKQLITLERQRRLFAVIGHELRTPAAALSMLIDRAQQEEPNEEQRHLMLQQSTHLLSVLDELRYVVRPKDSTEPLPMGSTTLAALTTAIMNSLQPMMAQKDIEGQVIHGEGADWPVQLSTQLVRQILLNLTKNAILHSKASKIWIEVRALQSGQHPLFEIKVCDNGLGMKDAEALFAPYARGDTEAEGSGLGLYICRILTEQLGGQLGYAKLPGGGSCFALRLSAEVDTSSTARAARPAALQNLSGLSVLLVEDNAVISKVTEVLLSKAGAHVTLVSDGAEGLAAARTKANGFDLILTDIMMPNLDGYGMTQRLRQSGYSGTIIGVSAATIGEESERMLKAGANACVGKPLTLEKLLVALQALEPVAA